MEPIASNSASFHGGESIGQTIKDGEYQIVSAADDTKTLSIAENGTNVELNSRKDDGRHTFDIQYLGDGYYSIVNKINQRKTNLSPNQLKLK